MRGNETNIKKEKEGGNEGMINPTICKLDLKQIKYDTETEKVK